MWDGLSPFIHRRLAPCWAFKVVAADASPQGLGACAAPMPAETCAELGRVSERWRYRCPAAGRQPRRRALLTEWTA
eukprot:4537013-Lingulodinium_polyedra.AAC.1